MMKALKYVIKLAHQNNQYEQVSKYHQEYRNAGYFHTAYTVDQLKALAKVRPTLIVKSELTVIGSSMCVLSKNSHQGQICQLQQMQNISFQGYVIPRRTQILSQMEIFWLRMYPDCELSIIMVIKNNLIALKSFLKLGYFQIGQAGQKHVLVKNLKSSLS